MQFKKNIFFKCQFAKHQAKLYIHTLTHYKYTTQLCVFTFEMHILVNILMLRSDNMVK